MATAWLVIKASCAFTMTSRAMPKATATRASTRTTRATAQLETSLPGPTRPTRTAKAKSSGTTAAQSVGRSTVWKCRFIDYPTQSDKNAATKVATSIEITSDADREPIKVSYS